MVSFDIVSLYTKIPVDEAIEGIKELTDKDTSLLVLSYHDVSSLILYRSYAQLFIPVLKFSFLRVVPFSLFSATFSYSFII
jgi:hypothetical protein